MINAGVRRVLTTQWVDITKVSVSSVSGIVYLTGHLVRMTASHSEFSEGGLRELDSRVRKVPGVRDVKYRFDNWERKLTALWVPIYPESAPATAPDAPADHSST